MGLSFSPIFLLIFTIILRFLFAFRVKVGQTKHKIVTLVATTLKVLLTVAKANGRFSRCKLNTGNVYDLFLNLLIHISPIGIKKGSRKGNVLSGEIAQYSVGANCVRPRETAGLPYE